MVEAPAPSVAFQSAPEASRLAPAPARLTLHEVVTVPPGERGTVHAVGDPAVFDTLTSAQKPVPQSDVVVEEVTSRAGAAVVGGAGDGTAVVGVVGVVGPLVAVVGGVEGLGVEGCAGVVVGVGPVGDAPGWFATVVPGPGGVVVPVVAPVAPPEVAAERLAQKSKAVDAPAASVRFQAAPVTRTVGPDAVQWPLARLVTGPPGRISSVQSTGEVLALVTVTSAQYPRPQSVRIEVVPRTLPPMGCGATTGGDGATVVGGAG